MEEDGPTNSSTHNSTPVAEMSVEEKKDDLKSRLIKTKDQRKNMKRELTGHVVTRWYRAPEIILLDEPFSHIDNFKKQSLRRNLFKYLKTNNIACVLATHDKDDVLSFADQMMVLHKGSVLSIESPSYMYSNPAHPLVAAFFGEYSAVEGKLYYAHQITLVENSSLKASVKDSLYRGEYYLIEADLNGDKVSFKNKTALAENSIVSLALSR